MLPAGTVAVSFELLTNVVVSAAPFQVTVDPDTNPAPVTVNVYPAPPGAVDAGVIGYNTGTGLFAAIASCGATKNNATATKGPNRFLRMPLQVI
jgi:hypothetical protein